MRYPYGNSESDPCLVSHIKIKSRWILYLSVTGKTTKLIEDKGKYIYDFGVGR